MAYTTNAEIIASVEAFAAKIPDSLIKSRVEKWIAEVRPTERITYEQLEQFVAFSTHLPVELQNYPQSFAAWIKNGAETKVREDAGEVKATAELGKLVNANVAHVPNVNAPKNAEETLHKLGTLEGSKGGKKISDKGGEVKAKSKPVIEEKIKPAKAKKVEPVKSKPIAAKKPLFSFKSKK